MVRKLRDEYARTEGDPVKVALAARWRAETTMTVGWIAERLAMSTSGYLNITFTGGRGLVNSSQYQELTLFPDPFPVGSQRTGPGSGSATAESPSQHAPHWRGFSSLS